MRANLAAFPLVAMCRVLGLSTSGYDDWLHRRPSARALRDAELKVRIKAFNKRSGTRATRRTAVPGSARRCGPKASG